MVESYNRRMEPPLRVMRCALLRSLSRMAPPKLRSQTDIVPVLDGELGGEDGAAAGVAVVEDFEQDRGGRGRDQGGEAPVVEDEEPGLGQPLYELGVRTVAAGEGEFVEERETRKWRVEMPRRQAWWPSAHAMYDFPDPVAPLINTVWPSRIHWPEARCRMRERSRPRGALKLMSSMVASRWSLAWPLRRW